MSKRVKFHDDDDAACGGSSDDDDLDEEREMNKCMKEVQCNDDDIPCIEEEIKSSMLGQQRIAKVPRSEPAMFAQFTAPISFPVRKAASNNVVVPSTAQDLSYIFDCSKRQNVSTLYVIVFFKNGCPPCAQLKNNVLPQLQAKYPRVVFVYVDVMNPSFAPYTGQLQITATPTLVFLKGCSMVARQVGPDATAIETHIMKLQ